MRVIVAYSDDPLVQRIQRKRLAALALLRAEIDGMLGPWRSRPSQRSRLFETARQFDMQVGSALIEALEGAIVPAHAILERVRDEIRGEIASRARLAYVFWTIISTLAVLSTCIAAYLLVRQVLGESLIRNADRTLLLAGMSTGVLGSLYSIAIRIEQRNLSNDMRQLDSFTDSLVRVGLGAMGAFILGCFLISGAIEINFGVDIKPEADRHGDNFIYLVLIAGFLAGFVERLVPDLLNSYAITGRKEPPRAQSPATATAVPEHGVPSDVLDQPEPTDESEVTNPPSDEEDVDGCDAHLDDPATQTADEDLPPTSGGVASH